MTNHCGIVLKETEDPTLSRKKRGSGFSKTCVISPCLQGQLGGNQPAQHHNLLNVHPFLCERPSPTAFARSRAVSRSNSSSLTKSAGRNVISIEELAGPIVGESDLHP